jgi:DUF438 domain-containing protein
MNKLVKTLLKECIKKHPPKSLTTVKMYILGVKEAIKDAEKIWGNINI